MSHRVGSFIYDFTALRLASLTLYLHTGSHQVYSNTDDIWDARLNQTEISGNKNKFYILQLLHPIGNSSTCQLFTRWGRVGENGQSQFKVIFFVLVFTRPCALRLTVSRALGILRWQ